MSSDLQSATGGKSLGAMLARIQRTGESRSALKAARTTTDATPVAASARCAARQTSRAPTGQSSKQLVAAAIETLDTIVQQRGLEQTELVPTSEYPTPLTRLPLFPPVTRATAIEMFKRGWTRLASSWDGGGVFRSGPALNVYDEDTLLGLIALRSRRIKGPGDRMPVPVRCLDSNDDRLLDGVVAVDLLYFRVSQLESAIRGNTPKGGWSGHELARRRESLDDLAGLQLRFDQPRDSRDYSRKTIALFTTTGFSIAHDPCYYVQFHPLVSQWLEGYHTFIDIALRRQLSDLGRAIHRFLASQRSNQIYRVAVTTLYEAIGAPARVGKLNQQARLQLAIMQRERFIASFAMIGTGRAQPFVLEVQFSAKTT